MPRFTVLTHDHPFLHWDFLLEAGEALRAWRLLWEPVADQEIQAESLPDHRKLYLDYEGPVSGGRGTVTRWDTGDYSGPLDGPEITLFLKGRCLNGTVTLVDYGPDGWRLRYSPATEKPCD